MSWLSFQAEALNKTLPSRFAEILDTLRKIAQKHNFTIYVVGGFVRDVIMGREPNDLDIMVEGEDGGARFAGVVAKELGLHDPVTFPRFGTAMLEVGGEKIEFVMPRKEYYTPETRKPQTELGTIEQDALRRDFGANALFLRVNDMEVMDLTGHGIEDINNKVIRVADPDNADLIFSQDPLRMLRAIRQSLQLGFEIDPGTIEAINRNVSRMEIISQERIKDELSKMLTLDSPSKSIRFLQSTGLLPYVMPELQALEGLTQESIHHEEKDVFEHTMMVLDEIPNDLVLRLSALLHDVAKPTTRTITQNVVHFLEHEKVGRELAEKMLRRLKFPNDVINQVTALIGEHMRPHHYQKEWRDKSVRRMVRDLGDLLEASLQLAEADVRGSKMSEELMSQKMEALQELRQRTQEVQQEKKVSDIKDLLSGDELMQLFNVPQGGPWIKHIKNHLTEKQMENPNFTHEEAIEAAKEFFYAHPDEMKQLASSWPSGDILGETGHVTLRRVHMEIQAADKVVIDGNKATITKDTGETVEIPVEQLATMRPDLVGRTAAQKKLEALDINATFCEDIRPQQFGEIETGDEVMVKRTQKFGHVIRASQGSYRVDVDGQVNTYWKIELEKR